MYKLLTPFPVFQKKKFLFDIFSVRSIFVLFYLYILFDHCLKVAQYCNTAITNIWLFWTWTLAPLFVLAWQWFSITNEVTSFEKCIRDVIFLWINKGKGTTAGFEPTTSGLTCRRSTNWAKYPYVGGLPILSISLLGGASQKSWLPYTALQPGITPKLRYNLGRGSMVMHRKGIRLFYINIM